MKLIAQNGELELYLKDGEEETDPLARGVLRDSMTGKERPILIQQALKWGGWEAPEGAGQ